MFQIPRVSIIMPCYNHGQYIDEALAGIELIEDKDMYEVIIVDDGSTDAFTKQKLAVLKETGKYTMLFQKNQGVSVARNYAISNAKADIILPLDADNKVYPEYLYKGLATLEANPDISVVYANGLHFGERNDIKYQRDFNLQALMLDNFVDTCAVFRKKLWEDVGGYDITMRSGYEDWEFWLHAAFKGHKFHHIDEVLFEYRMLSDSRNHRVKADKKKTNSIMDYMMQKHGEFYSPKLIDDTLLLRYRHNPAAFIYKFILRLYFPKKYYKLVAEGKLRKYIV